MSRYWPCGPVWGLGRATVPVSVWTLPTPPHGSGFPRCSLLPFSMRETSVFLRWNNRPFLGNPSFLFLRVNGSIFRPYVCVCFPGCWWITAGWWEAGGLESVMLRVVVSALLAEVRQLLAGGLSVGWLTDPRLWVAANRLAVASKCVWVCCHTPETTCWTWDIKLLQNQICLAPPAEVMRRSKRLIGPLENTFTHFHIRLNQHLCNWGRAALYFCKAQYFSLESCCGQRKLGWKFSVWMFFSLWKAPSGLFFPIIHPDPSLPSRSSSPLPELWRSAPTTLFLIWNVSPFHAGHSSLVPPIRAMLYRSLSQSCVSHVLLRTAHLRLWTPIWN